MLRRYDQDLDTAFEQARAQGDLTPLVETVRRWWFEADAWCDPEGQREFLARVGSVVVSFGSQRVTGKPGRACRIPP